MLSNNFLQSKYPIICASMNQVSDYNLISAAAEAGITPGIFWNQITKDEIDSYMKKYYESNIIMTYPAKDLLREYENIRTDVKYIELVRFTKLSSIDLLSLKKITEHLSKKGKKIILKGNKKYPIKYDALLLQGMESAGSGSVKSIYEEFENHRNENVIVSGGIDSKEKISYFLNKGALAVSIGTLFAVCSESKLSLDAKNKIINSTIKDLSRIGTARKQGLIMNSESDDTYNYTDRLKIGIQNPENGIIYCGTAIGTITKIKTIKEVVDELITKSDSQSNLF